MPHKDTGVAIKQDNNRALNVTQGHKDQNQNQNQDQDQDQDRTINLEDGREAPSKARKKGAKRHEFLVYNISYFYDLRVTLKTFIPLSRIFENEDNIFIFSRNIKKFSTGAKNKL